MYVLEWRTVSALTRGLFWYLFPELRSNDGNKHHNNTRVSAEIVRHENKYIILFLTLHNDDINDDKNNDLHTSNPYLTRWVYVLLMTSQSIVDDVTITRQLWRNHVNSDIELVKHRFFYCDIHDRSCKKLQSVFTEELTPYLAREGEVWGVVRKCNFWSKFYHYNDCGMGTTALYITAI